MASLYSDVHRPAWPRLSGLTCVRKCMCVVLHHTKNGVPARYCLLINLVAPSTISSSMVSIRFFVSGPVSSIFCPPFPLDQQCRTPRGPYFFLNSGKSFADG